ncbi:MAG TPA: hypothetical protein VFC41_02490, partial [Anaerovoracaceae bacterium]|nr:hypothetical protein [Anaerovoracaceae bacterium]
MINPFDTSRDRSHAQLEHATSGSKLLWILDIYFKSGLTSQCCVWKPQGKFNVLLGAKTTGAFCCRPRVGKVIKTQRDFGSIAKSFFQGWR